MTIKMLFVDMEGTLFEKQGIQLRPGESHSHHSLWSRLMHELGEGALADDAQAMQKWQAGGYRSYLDWVDESVRILKRHGLTRGLFEKTLDGVSYSPGVVGTFEDLHARGIKTAIVSGGFMEQARRAQRDLRITHAYAAVELFWDGEGQIVHWNMFPSDYRGKVDLVRLMMREYGFGLQECAFVGDGENDAHIAREVGTSFAYQAHLELRAVATHEIEDFSEILQWIS